jgi:hypothetical protein
VKLVLHIDRLVLRGVAAHERDALVAALHTALAHEFSQPGMAEHWAASPSRDRVQERFSPAAGQLPQGAAQALAQGGRR